MSEERSTTLRSSETGERDPGNPDTAASYPSSSCEPVIGGLAPAGISPIKIECPGNYTRRVDAKEAIPITGRFTTEAEVIDAFCILKPPSAGSTGVFTHTQTIADGNSGTIDFSTSVVVAFAYDTVDGASPSLYRRGDELWLKIQRDECRATEPSQLASVVFVVPKTSAVKQQTCSVACE